MRIISAETARKQRGNSAETARKQRGENTMYKLGFYVPPSHLEAVKTALFAAGAGRIGNYDSCAWQSPGQGQFRPLRGSQPYLGQTGVVETVEEYRVELVCADELVQQVIHALRAAHPYEEPAFDVVKLEQITRSPESALCPDSCTDAKSN